MYLHLQLFMYFRGIDRNYLKVQHFKFASCKYLLCLYIPLQSVRLNVEGSETMLISRMCVCVCFSQN